MSYSKSYTVIIGGGLSGIALALAVKRAGGNPLVVEKRAYLGYEMVGRYQMYVEKNAETDEETSAWQTEFSLQPVQIENEYCFYQGETKAQLLRRLREESIPYLFFCSLAGVFTDEYNQLSAVLLANSYGLYQVKASHLVDCSGEDTVRHILSIEKSPSRLLHSAYTIEVENIKTKETRLSGTANWNGSVNYHHSKRADTSLLSIALMKNEMSAGDRFSRSKEENRVKSVAADVIGQLRKIPGNEQVEVKNIGFEAAVEYEEEWVPQLAVIDNIYQNPYVLHFNFSERDLINLMNEAASLAAKIHKREGATSSQLYLYGEALEQKQLCRLEDEAIVWMDVEMWPLQLMETELPLYLTDATIVGLGASGMAALEAIRQDSQYIGVELQSLLGGTRTAGHVPNYYYGYRGGHTEKLNRRLKDFEKQVLNLHKTDPNQLDRNSLALMFHSEAYENNDKMLLQAVVCGAYCKEERLHTILVNDSWGLCYIKATNTIDTSGNGDVAALAGCRFEYGDPQDGVPQTFSQWGIDEKNVPLFHEQRFSGDYDAVDVTSFTDMMRASTVAQLNNSTYYSSNPVSYREGRRIVGEEYLTLAEAISGKQPHQFFAVAESTIDNYGRTSTELARMGLACCEKIYKIALPFGCFRPLGIAGLFVGGKAISAERDVVGTVRMNADVQNAGYALGIAVRKSNLKEKDPDYEKVCGQLQEEGLIPKEFLQQQRLGAEEAVTQLDEKDPYRLLEVLLQQEEEVVPYLRNAFATAEVETKKMTYAKCLAWFGDASGSELLKKRMEYLIKYEVIDENSDISTRCDAVKHGVQGDINDYWELNQLILVSEKIGDADFDELLIRAATVATAGGQPHVSKITYYASRRDMIEVPFYERIFNLAYVFSKRPIPQAKKALEHILEQENIGGNFYTYDPEELPLFFSSYLELTVAIAAALCGSTNAQKKVQAYTGDCRSVLAKFARRYQDIISDVTV